MYPRGVLPRPRRLVLAWSLPRPWARHPPPAGILPTSLCVDVDYVAGISGGDLPRGAQGVTGRGDVPQPVQAQPVEPPGDRADRAPVSVGLKEFVCDPVGGPLVFPPPGLDQLEHPLRHAGGPVGRGAGGIDQAGRAVAVVATDLLRQGRPGDPELSRDVRDRASTVYDFLDGSALSLRGQWGVTVDHERVS